MKRVSFLYRMIQGAIGKKYVVKHYRYGVVVTKYPDMSRVKPSRQQRILRNLFREAQAYAKSLIQDPIRKEAFRKELKKGQRVYTAAISLFFKRHKEHRLKEGFGAQAKKLERHSKQKLANRFTARTMALPFAKGWLWKPWPKGRSTESMYPFLPDLFTVKPYACRYPAYG